MERTGITIQGQRETAREALAEALAETPGGSAITSLYLHIPFCFHKCHYCDFYSFVDSQDRFPVFVDRLLEELRVIAPAAGPLTTVFFGGGTPTLLPAPLWDRLLTGMWSLFERGPGLEVSVECNPETATAELMGVLAAGGVNRISVGAQTFNREHLKALERWHDPDNVQKALGLALDAGIRRRSLDLIFGIPGQTLEEWDADLRTALAIPQMAHLSCYALTYEPGTAMTKRLELGRVTPIDEGVEAEMFEHTARVLGGAGFERYEVSNFAVPGEECRHNLAYWRQEPWLAAGPSASGHALASGGGSWRWKNVPRLTDWMVGVERTGWSPVVDLERPEPRRLLAERLMTGLRLREGVDGVARLGEAAALGCDVALRARVDRAVSAGELVERDGRWMLTSEGLLRADAVCWSLMEAASAEG